MSVVRLSARPPPISPTVAPMTMATHPLASLGKVKRGPESGVGTYRTKSTAWLTAWPWNR